MRNALEAGVAGDGDPVVSLYTQTVTSLLQVFSTIAD